MSTLVRSEHPLDSDLNQLRATVDALEHRLDERRAEIAQVKGDLEAFRVRYRSQVGLLHEQLDELELKLAEAELGELSRRIEEAASTSSEPAPPAAAESAPRFTSDGVRKLFREVAKSIHPDLTSDEAARARRHALMIEANRAYASGDEEQLRSILLAWEKSPEAVQGFDEEAMRLRLERRITQIEEQLKALENELARVRKTSLWQLKAMVDKAAAEGTDLVTDMVRRLRRDILVASNRLEAMT